MCLWNQILTQGLLASKEYLETCLLIIPSYSFAEIFLQHLKKRAEYINLFNSVLFSENVSVTVTIGDSSCLVEKSKVTVMCRK
jgi:hypothetical protein